MKLRAHEDVRSFLDAASPLLMPDEARYNLLFGICSTLIAAPRAYPTFHLWTLESGGEVVWVGLMTPPFNIVVARPARPDALDSAAEALHTEGMSLPGVTGALPEVDDFTDRWLRAFTAEATPEESPHLDVDQIITGRLESSRYERVCDPAEYAFDGAST